MRALVVVCKHVSVRILSARSLSNYAGLCLSGSGSSSIVTPAAPSLGARSTMGLSPWGLGEMDLELICSCPSLLQEIRQQLNSDHRGKMETLDIDRGCLSLDLKSPNISLKINPTRVPDG